MSNKGDSRYIKMNGLVTSDIDTIKQMEMTGEGKIIPAHVRSSGTSLYASESIVSPDGFDIICQCAVAYGIAEGTVEEINETNILEADLLAMRRAIDDLHTPTGEPYQADFALIDGNISRDFQLPAKAIIKGDSLSMSIAAASILAKVTRDRMCEDMDRMYPQYGIAKHKGYGTKVHMDALRQYGPSPIHRTKFIRFLNEDAP